MQINELKTTISDIQRSSFVDGPGIRTTVFFKGCNLRCKWCHNPETWNFNSQMMFYKNKCTNCGKCKEFCPYNMEQCDLCGKCELVCPNDARKICGKIFTVEEIFNELMKDKDFYDTSEGGVTFSGGEPMLQVDFLVKLLSLCKKNGIHTAVDTAGNVPWESFEKVIPYTDLFLYDIKCISPELYLSGTGVINNLILENYKRLIIIADVIVRIPLIGGFNDSIDEINKITNFMRKFPPKDIEPLEYHKMGNNKFDALGMHATEFEISDKMQLLKSKLLQDGD